MGEGMICSVKQGLRSAMVGAGVDALFRYLNRDLLLSVMYHGVTERDYDPPVWTQLPVEVFKSQLLYLRDRYAMVSLPEVVRALRGGPPLPERAALVTFDDGVRNNFTVAFPILRELGIPACVFLTVDLIGTAEILWFDELYLLLSEGVRRRVELPLPGVADAAYRRGEIREAYRLMAGALKLTAADSRQEVMARLRDTVPLDWTPYRDDFGLLTWEEVREMEASGLVGFGTHTATHRILSELKEAELEGEVAGAGRTFARELGYPPAAFCFPNGRPGLDFHADHQAYLASLGYVCAFTTEYALFDAKEGDPMAIGRIAAGNDWTSEPAHFRLGTSGVPTVSTLLGRLRP